MLGLSNFFYRGVFVILAGTTDDAKRAVRLLKDAGFKIDFHLMPDLPG